MATRKDSDTSAGTGTSSASGAGDRNSVQQSRPRQRKSRARPQPAADTTIPIDQRRKVNSIAETSPRSWNGRADEKLPSERSAASQRSEVKVAASSIAPTGTAAHTFAQEDLSVVPDHVRRRFIQVGRKYYFPDGVRAFTDRGRRLTTPSENTEVIRSLVTIAQARGWKEITVRGTDAFRREAWFAARQLGLDVRGYRPTDVEQARLVRTIAGQADNAARPSGAAQVAGRNAQGRQSTTGRPRAMQELLTGRLVEHGRATYKQDPRQPMSYFVKLETERGERVIWGVDLERAFRESVTQPKVGDLVGLRSPRRESVKVKAAAVSKDGRVVGQKDVETHRNQWVVEKQEFFEARRKAGATVRDTHTTPATAVRGHPELVGTYLQIRAAELAAKRFNDPNDRERFVSSVRTALADSVDRGDPLPQVKLRERAAAKIQPRTRGTRGQEEAPARG